MDDGRAGGRARIAYFCPGSLREGTALHAHVMGIAEGLRARGWSVEVFAPRHDWRPGRAALARAAAILATQARLMAGGRPDLVYTRWHFASFPAALWARSRGIPFVVEVNGPYEDLLAAWPRARWLSWALRPAMRRQLLWAEAVVAVTSGLSEYVRAEAGRAAWVVANGADTALFRPDAPPLPGLPPAYAVFFGELAPWHDLPTMIAAVREPAWPAGVGLVIVGGGAQQGRV
ncbi:MAG: glycosyltransferase, partial [Rhodospirillaceae bacterium]|nr:glycosyltransferase [Rhodospirillaceae bacterium]